MQSNDFIFERKTELNSSVSIGHPTSTIWLLSNGLEIMTSSWCHIMSYDIIMASPWYKYRKNKVSKTSQKLLSEKRKAKLFQWKVLFLSKKHPNLGYFSNKLPKKLWQFWLTFLKATLTLRKRVSILNKSLEQFFWKSTKTIKIAIMTWWF